MNVGMRMRGGLLASLMMLAVPVGAMLVSAPATAQTVATIQVEGNRRVEVETIRSYFKPGPGGRLDQALEAFTQSLERSDHLNLFASWAAARSASVLIALGRLDEARPLVTRALVEGPPLSPLLELASPEEILKLAPGDPLAYAGYPQENIAGSDRARRQLASA